jgi:hypothetical protein
MTKPVSQAEIDPQNALETLRELASYGFGDAEFELVHHWHTNGKLIRFKKYREGLIQRKGLFRRDDNNHLLNLRLLCVLKRCSEFPPGRKNFKSLAD